MSTFRPEKNTYTVYIDGSSLYIYTHALSLAGLGVHVSSLSDSMNATILAQVELNQNSIHCFFFLGLGKG